MSQDTAARVASHQQHLRDHFTEQPQLPFGDLLTEQRFREIVAEEEVRGRQCFFTPLMTVWGWLWQSLRSASCWEAGLACMTWAQRRGQSAPSPENNAFGKARCRLPERLVARLARETGKKVTEKADAWNWQGHRVRVADGTTATMPDTPENQNEYPQSSAQEKGLGFPIVRLVVVFCLACGSALDMALGRWRGKGTGEASLLLGMLDNLEKDDVLLGDRYFSSYAIIASLQARGVHYVGRGHASRKVDFRRGVPLGKRDHIECWQKPANPGILDAQQWAQLPDMLFVREIFVRVAVRGFRVTHLVVVTTLLDADRYDAADLAELYRARWQVELNLRSLKSIMGMDHLRCQTPEMVRKELWMHLLAYNLVRSTMVRAAQQTNGAPDKISYSGALQALRNQTDGGPTLTDEQRAAIDEAVLAAIAKRKVGNRPNRVEPRAVKKRSKPYPRLKRPRAQCKRLKNQGLAA
jgi:hypothetical protein